MIRTPDIVRPTTKRAALAASVVLVLASGAVAPVAAHDGHGPAAHDPLDYAFRAEHPLKVYIDVDTQQDHRGRASRGNGQGKGYAKGRHKRHDQSINTTTVPDYVLRQKVSAYLPSYAHVVSRRHEADIIINATELNRSLSFHVTDNDARNKKYDKRRRYAGGKCGQFERAFYNRIQEQGVELADYKLSIRIKGEGHYSDTVRIKSTDSYRYGENLRAATNCGIVATTHYPNSAVADLFARSPETHRPLVAEKVAYETTSQLAHILVDAINARSEQYYAQLAAHYNGAGYGAHGDHRYAVSYDTSVRNYPVRERYDAEPAEPVLRWVFSFGK